MSLAYLLTGFLVGAIFGVVAAFLIVRWRINRQLGNFQENMEQVMDVTGEMEEAFDEMEDSMEPDFEEIEKEEKED